MQLNCFPGDESALAAVVVVDDEALLAAGEGGERLDGDVAAAPALVQEGVVHREPGGNCIKIGLPGKSILGDYFRENRTSRGQSDIIGLLGRLENRSSSRLFFIIL